MKAACWMRWTIVVGVLCACGCSKLTYERWETIQVGSSSPDAVKATLGDPWTQTDETWVYNEPDRHTTATVTFKDSKVEKTEWSSPEHPLVRRPDKPLQPGEREELHVQTIK